MIQFFKLTQAFGESQNLPIHSTLFSSYTGANE